MIFLPQLEQHFVESIDQCTIVRGYIGDTHSFPAITLLNPRRSQQYYGTDERLNLLQLTVRGYISTSRETSIADTEMLVRQIETAIYSFPRSMASRIALAEALISTQDLLFIETQQLLLLVAHAGFIVAEEARVLAIETDEGLMAPLGICDIDMDIRYVSKNSNYR
jgi:hypothetical protein